MFGVFKFISHLPIDVDCKTGVGAMKHHIKGRRLSLMDLVKYNDVLFKGKSAKPSSILIEVAASVKRLILYVDEF